MPQEIQVKKEYPLVDVNQLEVECFKHTQVDCPVFHRFGPGVYIREVQIPAGTLAIGHKQKFEQLNVFLKGVAIMLQKDGSVEVFRAPMIFTGSPGRKCGYIVEDSVWLNIYPTEETDVEKLEEMYLDKNSTWEAANELELLRNLKAKDDVIDFKNLVKEYGLSEEKIREQSENLEDQIPLPIGNYKFQVAKSAIQGKGIHATAEITKGEIIGPARIGDKRTVLGRYSNHARFPNAEMISFGNDIHLRAIKNIQGYKGGFVGDEITVDYRKTIKLMEV